MSDTPAVMIRPMHPEDLPEAERLSAESFHGVDVQNHRRNRPAPQMRSREEGAGWIRRATHLLGTDPGGCWVAEAEGATVGFAISFRRDLTWFLASYAVRPGLQGAGIGKPLLEAAVSHSRGCLRGMLAASDDPRALRRYRLAGFSLHPQMRLSGRVDRTSLPVVEHVRDGTPGDFALMDSVDRRVRDAARGSDHGVLSEQYRLLVVDHTTGSGYAYVSAAGVPLAVAATNRRTAARLMWEALAGTDGRAPIEIGHITAANEWALDVGVAARLSIGTAGFLALQGMKPPSPYLHHGSFL